MHHSALARTLTEDQIAQRAQVAAGHRGLIVSIAVLGVAIGVPFVMVITTLYNLLVGKMFSFERSFRQWFSFCSWTGLPSALTAIPVALVLATTETTQIGQEVLQPLSLNALFFHRAVGEPGFSLLNGLNLVQFVTLYLSVVGIKAWSGRSWLFSILFIAVPWLLIYGIWARVSFS
ncbi:MAG: YIP1 family protein [Pseudomonadota bacterium]